MALSSRRLRWFVLSLAISAVLGLLVAGLLALIGLALVALSQALNGNALEQAGAGLLVVLASALFGGLCGTLVRIETLSEDAILLVLIVGAGVIGAGAGWLAFVTEGAGLIALAGLLGLAGALAAARSAARLCGWLEHPPEELMREVRRLLP